MITQRVAVVGSGFAAWGAIKCLSEQKFIDIEVLDIGLDKPVEGAQEHAVANAKPLHGSYFPYGINDQKYPINIETERLCSSHALGGFSRVYSGAVIYPKSGDLDGWPQESIPTAKDYSAILEQIPILKEIDDLDRKFPLFPTDEDLKKKNENCSVLGASRIAIKSEDSTKNSDLKNWTIDTPLKELIDQKKIAYRGGVYVESVQTQSDGVTVWFKNEGALCSRTFDAVFIGAGCVNSTTIIDRSIAKEGSRTYSILAPGSVLQAFLRLPSSLPPFILKRRRHNLPEYFLEISNSKTQSSWSHTQLTALNQQIIEMICVFLPKWLHFIPRSIRSIIYFAMSGVKSSKVPVASLRSTICRDDFGTLQQKISITEKKVDSQKELISEVRHAVLQNWRKLSMIPLPFSSIFADFLRGNKLGGWHFGGTLPMRETPIADSDLFPNGEVKAVPRAYVLDSSSFPSIPSSTIALLSAANGHRVARQWVESRERGV